MKDAIEFLKNKGCGSGTNYTTNQVAELMRSYAQQSSNVTDDGELKVKRFLNHKFKDRPNPKDVNPYEAGATRKRK